jgi:hypothetical protein
MAVVFLKNWAALTGLIDILCINQGFREALHPWLICRRAGGALLGGPGTGICNHSADESNSTSDRKLHLIHMGILIKGCAGLEVVPDKKMRLSRNYA